MKTQILAIGKIRDGNLKSLFDDYFSRLQHYGNFEHVELKEGKGQNADQIKTDEAKLILDALPKSGIVIAMDERGKNLTSREFAKLFQDFQMRAVKNVTFCIGGADGLHQSILQRADRKICLSAMTLTHEFARTLLAEQIYRAHTILRGEPYHK